MEISPIGSKNLPSIHVLVVDDEPLIRWSVAETLVHSGCEVTEAGNAKDTMTRVASGPRPDVILLDFRLPDSNDLRLLESIRRKLPESAVIMMTAYGTPDVIERAVKLGAYRVMSKPVELRDLATLVRQAFL